MKRYKMVCSDCGSEDIVSDAYAEWNKFTQRWELSDLHDYSYCRSCESESRIDEVEIIELNLNTKVL
jgi:hypothetical protein